MADKVQQSEEYYRWLYEGGPRPVDVSDKQADIDRRKVLGKPSAASQSYHPNSIMGRMTPAERAKLRALIRAESDVEYEAHEENYEHALMRELDEKGL